MVKRFQNILYMFFFEFVGAFFVVFWQRFVYIFWVENVPFFSEGFCSEILWRCFFTFCLVKRLRFLFIFFLGRNLFSKVVLVESRCLARDFSSDFFVRIVSSEMFGGNFLFEIVWWECLLRTFGKGVA